MTFHALGLIFMALAIGMMGIQIIFMRKKIEILDYSVNELNRALALYGLKVTYLYDHWLASNGKNKPHIKPKNPEQEIKPSAPKKNSKYSRKWTEAQKRAVSEKAKARIAMKRKEEKMRSPVTEDPIQKYIFEMPNGEPNAQLSSKMV